jgi:hypothetical protein
VVCGDIGHAELPDDPGICLKMPGHLLDREARWPCRDGERQHQLIGQMAIDRGAAGMMTQQVLGRFLCNLFQRLATRSQGAEAGAGILVFCDEEAIRRRACLSSVLTAGR